MAADGFLVSAATYLGAAVVSVPIATRIGLGSVLGYLVAGVVVGPAVLGLVSAGTDVMHVAEFGVVMMLFLIGLELQPAKLWQMRGTVFGLGSAQVAITALAVAMAALLLGQALKPAVAIGLIVAMSSTAIVLQALTEKGVLKSPPGETSFAVLLFQDLAVIPILAVMPLLASRAAVAGGEAHEAGSLIETLPAPVAALAIVAAVASIVFAGRHVMRPLFRIMAMTRMREVFTATALLLVAGTALLMQSVGLSPALGAFVAGVVLADSEFRHEIETDIDPFKGLLLGLFFISVGAGIEMRTILEQPLTIVALVLAIVALKAGVAYAVARVGGLTWRDALLAAIALSQIGEFAFVLIAYAGQNGVLDTGTGGLLTAAVALSMLTTPLLLIAFDRFVKGRADEDEREADVIEEKGRVIIAGFGRMGQIAGRILLGRGVPITILEHDAEQLESLRRFGFTLYYGDARRHDLLLAAGADEASLLVVATDEQETTNEIVEMARRNFPNLKIVARAFDRPHSYELEALGADRVVRETFAGGIEMGTEALKELGLPAFEAERVGRIFRRHDIETMAVLRELRKTVDWTTYGAAFRERREMLSRVLTRDIRSGRDTDGMGWDSETLREEMRSGQQDAAQ